MENRTSYASWGPLYVSLILFLLNYIYTLYIIADYMFYSYETSCMRVKEHAYDRRAANRAMTSFTLVGHSADFTLSVPMQRA